MNRCTVAHDTHYKGVMIMHKNKFEMYMKKTAIGVIISIVIIAVLFVHNKNMIFGEIFFYETIPYYNMNESASALFKFTENESIEVNANNKKENPESDNKKEDNIENNIVPVNNNDMELELIGVDDIEYQPEADSSNLENHFVKENITIDNIDNLKDLSYLKKNFYLVDKKTAMTEDLFDVEKFLSTDLSIDTSDGKPKILIFHTHSQEMFADSKPNDINEGIVGAGNRLAQTLETKYGIKTIHDTSVYDVVDGSRKIIGAYERMEPNVRKILKENPSIEFVIDLHRDGVNDDVKLVKNINGKPTAQIMFFNGLCKINSNGQLSDIESLPNQYIDTNLALSFRMQLTANSLYPGLTRKVYLNAYRYSLHMIPKSMLIEAGAQTNTKEEIYNAMDLLAEVLAQVVSK